MLLFSTRRAQIWFLTSVSHIAFIAVLLILLYSVRLCRFHFVVEFVLHKNYRVAQLQMNANIAYFLLHV